MPALLSMLVAFLLAFHAAVPNTLGRLGSLLETFLPWLGLTVPGLLALAFLRRSCVALIALLLPVVAWISLFGGLLLPSNDSAGEVTALQHNVSDENPDPAGTARSLIKTQADLIALEELTPSALPAFAAAMASHYPHRATKGTVGLWSKYPPLRRAAGRHQAGGNRGRLEPRAEDDGQDDTGRCRCLCGSSALRAPRPGERIQFRMAGRKCCSPG